MTRQYKLKTNFTAGELDPRLFGRADLRAYENGAAVLKNVIPDPTGGVSRRPGMQFLAEVPEEGRLIGFEFNTNQFYLLVLTHFRLDIFQDGQLIQGNIPAPWRRGIIDEIAWAQSADTLFLAHPELRTRLVTRQGPGDWRIAELRFAFTGSIEHVPHRKFGPPESIMTPSGTDGTITLTVDAPTFDAAKHPGVAFRLRGGEVRIDSVISDTEATAEVQVPLEVADPTPDWTEAAVSPARGWPTTVGFHQNRLVLGGAANLPNHLWMSKINDLFNFDLGTGLDDEAIHFQLLADEVNAIRGLMSRGELQVFTSGGEWLVTGDPMTPRTVQAKRQTRIGSRDDRYVPPRDVDGATMFVARGGDKVSEFALTNVQQTFTASDLSLLARHRVKDIVDFDYDDTHRVVYCVLADGGMITLTQFRAEKVTAWSRQTTAGHIHALAVVNRFVNLLVARANGVFLEVLEPTVHADAAMTGSADPPTATWSGLDHLEGESVQVLADGRVKPPVTVVDGAFELDAPAAAVVAGLTYAHEIAPLPALANNALGLSYNTRIRLIAGTYRVNETSDLRVDVGAGPEPLILPAHGAEVLDAAPPVVSGDRTVRALGWQAAGTAPLWRIVGDRPLPFTLLSATTEIKVND
mgnify:CR=1 FL=1